MTRRTLVVGLLAWTTCAALSGCAAARGPASDARRRLSFLTGTPQARSLTCESRSGADLLAAHGIRVSEEQVFARLPRSDNPDLGFVGDPDDPAGGLPPAGYGVHAPPLAAALRALGLDATAESGRDLAWLAAETAAGRPVVAWVTGSCEPSRRVTRRDAAGRPYVAVPGEHVVLVVHVGAGAVWALDPATGGWREFARDDFDAAWALFDRSAVSARGPLAPPAR